MTKSKTRPSQAITIKDYADLERFISAFADGHINLLILVGGPGLAKSQIVRETLGIKACWIEGNATAFGLYSRLWKHQNSPVVIDDVDGLYSSRAAVRLLKCLCQTDELKHVAWHSGAASVGREGLPREFSTTSRVVIIANEWKSLNMNVAAVQDRGHVVFFEPTFEEVHRRVAAWFWDQEVFDWFGAHAHLITEPSMRKYVQAAELKAAGLDWIGIMLGDAFSETTRRVSQLKADRSFASEAERVKAFCEHGWGSRSTYFNHAKKLKRRAAKKPLQIPLQRLTAKEKTRQILHVA